VPVRLSPVPARSIIANGGSLDIKPALTVDKNGDTPNLEVTNVPGSTPELESTIAPGTNLTFLYGSGAPAGTLPLGKARAAQPARTADSAGGTDVFLRR